MDTSAERIEQPRRLLTVQEAAQLLGVSAQTIRNWLCAGKCPLEPVRLGRAVRFRSVDVERITG